MKKTLLLVAALFYFVGLNAQGVIFEKGTWKEVLEKANRENKIIFVDIYTSWCGPCKNVAKTVSRMLNSVLIIMNILSIFR